MTVGGKEFTFKKPVTKHVLNLRTKGYQEWFESEALNESTSSNENHKAYSDRWREFCRDAILLGDPFPVDPEHLAQLGRISPVRLVPHPRRGGDHIHPGTPPSRQPLHQPAVEAAHLHDRNIAARGQALLQQGLQEAVHLLPSGPDLPSQGHVPLLIANKHGQMTLVLVNSNVQHVWFSFIGTVMTDDPQRIRPV